MHTDEYEISVGREMTLCRKMIQRLRKAVSAREVQYGLSTEELFDALERGQTEGSNPDLSAWLHDHQELKVWERRLKDYEAALETLKGI